MKSKNVNGSPSTAECFTIMVRHGMPEHIVRHSRAVCGVSLYLARKLTETGLRLDQDLIRAGALLHDIGKAYCFHQPVDHALTGAKILKRLGYHKVASVVRQHVVISGTRPAGRVSETEVVNYADKRVLEDRITPLKERLDYIVRRYGRDEASISRIKTYQKHIYQLEKDIFAVLPGGPGQLMFVDIERECRGYGDKQA